MKIRRSWLPAILTALVVWGCGVAFAGPKGSGKINPALMALHAEHATHAAQRNGLPFVSGNILTRVVNERVVVDAVADGDVLALKTALSTLGMQNIAVFGRVISGRLPISAIPALDGIASLRFAQPATSARRVGLVTSQGDASMRSDIARNTLGVTGAGVKVGVLSDSFNCLDGATADVTSEDLSTVQVIQEEPGCGSGTDEGRAMLQIVHDVAPGASLAFATAFGVGQAGFANNILALKAAGATVIVDDVIIFAEPMFQDGIIAQAVDTVVAQGASYFSAAGNDARDSYESPFRAGSTFTLDQLPSSGVQAPRFVGGVAHNFAPSGPADHFQSVTIPGGSSLRITLQWDAPFFSAGGIGSPSDVDIYVLNGDATTVVGGVASDDVGRDAFEIFSFTNTGATATFNIMIVSFCHPDPNPDCVGPLPGYVKYVYSGPTTIAEFDTASSTLYGHTNAAGAVAVGAANYSQTPAFGVNPPVLEPFSSAGSTPIFFDIAGNRLASAVIRRKPEIVAPDGANTTFFGGDDGDADSFPNFFGTSAAAPHAAGVAALLREKQPLLSPVSVSQALQSTAINMGPAGFDFDSGLGLIQADAAVGLVTTLQAEASAILPSSRSVQVGTGAAAFATVINAGPNIAVGVGIWLATPLLASFAYQMTNPATNEPIGQPNVPADIPPGGFQTYVISLTPSGAFNPTDVQFYFAGANTFPVTPIPGLNTLLLSSTSTPGPDIIALAATLTPELIVNLPGNTGVNAFAVATSNGGAAGNILVTANKGSLPITVTLCQTNALGACINPTVPAPSVAVNIAPGATPTFSFFVQGQGRVPFDPANNRISAVFTNKATGNIVGETSMAVRTQ